MSTLAWILALTAQSPYADYIGDPSPPRGATGATRTENGARARSGLLAAPSSRLTSTEPAPLPASPPPPSPRREAGRRVSDAPAPVKQWYSLTSHPGYEGFGAMNSRGQVVVEWHRRVGSSVLAPGPAPDVVVPVLGAPSCPNGQCPACSDRYRPR